MIGSSYDDPDISEQSDLLRKIDELKDQLKHSISIDELRIMMDGWREQNNSFGESTMTGDDCINHIEFLISHNE